MTNKKPPRKAPHGEKSRRDAESVLAGALVAWRDNTLTEAQMNEVRRIAAGTWRRPRVRKAARQ